MARAQTEEVQEDGSLLLTVPASHDQEIMMEILKHGAHVEILEPKWLRDKIIEEISSTTLIYISEK